jgi:hypothetical protein
MQMPRLLVLSLLAAGCSTRAPSPPPPVSVGPAQLDWLAVLARDTGLEPVVVSSSGSPLLAVAAPSPETAVIAIGPSGIHVDGRAVLGGRVADGMVRVTDARVRAVRGGHLILQLWDALRAANPQFSPAVAETYGGTRPALLVADRRAPVGLVADVALSIQLAGFAAPRWVVRDERGGIAAVALHPGAACPDGPTPSAGPPAIGTMDEPHVVAMGPPVVFGPCSSSLAEINAHKLGASVAGCYVEATEANPALAKSSDRIDIAYIVRPDGKVQGGYAEAGFSARAPGLEACLASALLGPQYPPADHGCLVRQTLAMTTSTPTSQSWIPAGPPPPARHLTAPLTWAELTLLPAQVRVELGQTRAGECPEGLRLLAALPQGDPMAAAADLDALLGAHALDLAVIQVRAESTATLEQILGLAHRMARSDGSTVIRWVSGR